MSNAVTIQAAPQATIINGTDRIPVSQGDGLPKTVTVQQLFDLLFTAAPLSVVDGHATGSLILSQVTNSIIDNVGQVAPADLLLPTASAGMNFLLIVGEAGANAWRIRAGATDKIYLNGVAGADNGYAGITAPTVGAYISVFSFKTGASTWDWMAVIGNGIWVAS